MHNERLSYAEQLEHQEWHKKREEILERDSHKCQMCGNSGTIDNPLNVHHRYYLYKRYAWSYDNSALITLCKMCHKLVHRTMPPLIYTKNKDRLIVMNFTPCYRCNGEGYFPEYKRIESGVCFRCRGARYEELIDNKEVQISSYYTNKTVFDLEKHILTDKQIAISFHLAYNFFSEHKESNNYVTTPKQALSYYYSAALNGLAEAQNNLGYYYREGIADLKIDYEKSLRWFLYSAMQGIYKAQRNLSWMFEFGIGVDKNMLLSMEWERLTWEQNDSDAANFAMRRVKDKSLNTALRYFYIRRIYQLAHKGNLKAKHYVSILESILKK